MAGHLVFAGRAEQAGIGGKELVLNAFGHGFGGVQKHPDVAFLPFQVQDFDTRGFSLSRKTSDTLGKVPNIRS